MIILNKNILTNVNLRLADKIVDNKTNDFTWELIDTLTKTKYNITPNYIISYTLI